MTSCLHFMRLWMMYKPAVFKKLIPPLYILSISKPVLLTSTRVSLGLVKKGHSWKLPAHCAGSNSVQFHFPPSSAIVSRSPPVDLRTIQVSRHSSQKL